MRVDIYLKLMGITKTRMAAKRLCDAGKILIQGRAVKPSAEIAAEDNLDLFLPRNEMKLRVLEIPPGKSVAKQDRARFMALEIIKEI